MDRRSARRTFVAVWMLEFSVLWAVFPLLELLLGGQLKYRLLAFSWTLAVTSFSIGFVLTEDEP